MRVRKAARYDLGEIRPGLWALKELDVTSPFSVLKVNGEETREMVKEIYVPKSRRILPNDISSRFPSERRPFEEDRPSGGLS
ncbi:MAG: hypothetical protein QI197_06600 [Candidatus Korarchaeota archaeon]|nr:hypothetical protein [Candidatus Korarchaeota archaeon]